MADRKTIQPGVYTYRELLNLADVNFEDHAKVKYGETEQLDYRRVSVGGLHFDDLDNVLVIPDVAVDSLEIRADGKVVGTLSVDHEDKNRTLHDLADTAKLPS